MSTWVQVHKCVPTHEHVHADVCCKHVHCVTMPTVSTVPCLHIQTDLPRVRVTQARQAWTQVSMCVG